MTEELIERLRGAGEILAAAYQHECISPYNDGEISERLHQAADRIEAQAAEIERLRTMMRYSQGYYAPAIALRNWLPKPWRTINE